MQNGVFSHTLGRKTRGQKKVQFWQLNIIILWGVYYPKECRGDQS